jgi:hypothetical protein
VLGRRWRLQLTFYWIDRQLEEVQLEVSEAKAESSNQQRELVTLRVGTCLSAHLPDLNIYVELRLG